MAKARRDGRHAWDNKLKWEGQPLTWTIRRSANKSDDPRLSASRNSSGWCSKLCASPHPYVTADRTQRCSEPATCT